MDIGSIFPLYEEDLLRTGDEYKTLPNRNRQYFSLCREALRAIAVKHDGANKRILLPAYTCKTVIDPFLYAGWECHYYKIDRNLRINRSHIISQAEKIRPTIVLTHPYCGRLLDHTELETLKFIKGILPDCILIEDITQCIFTTERPGLFDYFVGSIRKWCNIPDGGFIEPPVLDVHEELPENSTFLWKQTDAMFLRGMYFSTGSESVKQISLRLYKDAVDSISNNIELHRMSDLSEKMFSIFDIKGCEQIRKKNYTHLFNHLPQGISVQPICDDLESLDTAPLYFPVYVKDREMVQHNLAKEHIYAPVLWPRAYDNVLIDDDVIHIYDHILMIPIDQRYGTDDMDKIIKIFNN